MRRQRDWGPVWRVLGFVALIAAVAFYAYRTITKPNCIEMYAAAHTAADSQRVDSSVISPAQSDARGVVVIQAARCIDTRRRLQQSAVR